MKCSKAVNHVYRLVWSRVQEDWVAVAEISRGSGSGRMRILPALVAATLANTAVAAPPAGVVVNGGTEGVEYTFDASSPQNMTVTGTIPTSGTSAIVSSGIGIIGTLTNSGTISSTGGVYGINNGGTIGALTNSGTISGGNSTTGGGGLDNTGSLGTLTNSGTINGITFGINNSGTINTLTNTVSGIISGGNGATGGGGGLTNTGSLGTLSNSGTIDGFNYAIDNSGTITTINNTNTGVITSTGGNTLINEIGGTITTMTNNGTINGSNNGIANRGSTGLPNNGLIGTLTNNGTISTSSFAILNGGTINTLVNTNSGTISSATFVGIENDGSGIIGTLTNNGTISGAANTIRGAGIVNTASIGTLTNNGTIDGSVAGILMGSGGTITTLTNSGTIRGGDTNSSNAAALGSLTHTGINNAGTLGTLTNANTGIIRGSDTGLTNSGTITALSHVGLNNTSTIGTLTNNGTISGGDTGLINTGTINTLTNTGLSNSGTITTLTNNATISAGETGLNNTGTIGTLVGIGLNNSGTITTLANNSSISGDNTGLVNSGTIGALTNSGTITGATNAIFNDVTGVIGSITNTGTIAGNIQNASAQDLTFNGGTGTVFGKLTGLGGGTTIGTITGTGANVVFGSGNLLLNDNIDVGGNAVNNSGTAVVQVDRPLTITGNYNQGSNATLQIGVASGATTLGAITDTGYGRLVVSGDTTITAGASIRLQSNGYAFAAGQRFVVIDTAGVAVYNETTLQYSINNYQASITGSVVANGANSDLVLNITSAVPRTTATAPNAIAALNGLTSYTGISNAGLLNLYNATLGAVSQGSAANANRIGKQLGPLQADWASAAPIYDALDVISSHIESFRFPQDSEATGVSTGDWQVQRKMWAQAYGSHATQDQRDQVDGYGANYGAVVFGMDEPINDNWRAGGAFNYGNTEIKNSGDTAGDTTRIDNYGLIAYASYDSEPWYVNYSGAVAQQYYDTRRTISMPGFSDSASGSFSGQLYVARAEFGYPLSLSHATLTPLVSLMYSYRTQDGYTESSPNGAALRVNSADASSLKSAVGAKLEQGFLSSYGKFVLSGRAQWIHEFHDSGQSMGSSFAGDPSGQTAFTTVGQIPKADIADISLGMTMLGSNDLNLTVRYDLKAATGFLSQTGSLRLSKLF